MNKLSLVYPFSTDGHVRCLQFFIWLLSTKWLWTFLYKSFLTTCFSFSSVNEQTTWIIRKLYIHFWASLIAQLVKDRLQCKGPWFNFWVRKIHWRRDRLPTPVFWPREFHGLYGPWGHKESDTSNFHFTPLLLFPFCPIMNQHLKFCPICFVF